MRENMPSGAYAFYFIHENDTFENFSERNADRQMKKHWENEVKFILSHNKDEIEDFFSDDVVHYFYTPNGKIRNTKIEREIFEKIVDEQKAYRKKLEEDIALSGLTAYNEKNKSDFPLFTEKNRAAFISYHDETLQEPKREGDSVYLTVNLAAGDVRIVFTGVREYYPVSDFYEGTAFLDFELYRRGDGLYEYDLSCTSGELRIVFADAESKFLNPAQTIPAIVESIKDYRERFEKLSFADREVLLSTGSDAYFPPLFETCGFLLEQKAGMFPLTKQERVLYGLYKLSEKLNELDEFSEEKCGYEGFFELALPFDEIQAVLKTYAPAWLYSEYAQAKRAFDAKNAQTLTALSNVWRMKNLLALPEPVKSRYIAQIDSPFEDFKDPLDPVRSETEFSRIIFAYCESLLQSL